MILEMIGIFSITVSKISEAGESFEPRIVKSKGIFSSIQTMMKRNVTMNKNE